MSTPRTRLTAPTPLKRAVVFGMSGLDKAKFLAEVAGMAAEERGLRVRVDTIGARMYDERPDVPPGSILDLPKRSLDGLRRSVMKDVIPQARTSEAQGEVVLLNAHCRFRWRHGSFSAVNLDQLAEFMPEAVVCVVDNFHAIHARLKKEHSYEFSVAEVLSWRQAEINAAEDVAGALSMIYGHRVPFYVVARGPEADCPLHNRAVRTCYRLLFEPWRPIFYTGFPMTQVADKPEVLREIGEFVAEAEELYTILDPGLVDEFSVLQAARDLKKAGKEKISVEVNSCKLEYEVSEILYNGREIEGQIYSRDLALIDQSDGVVSLVPEKEVPDIPVGKRPPELSSGVERELMYALTNGRIVVVVWKPRDRSASPFQSTTAILVFTVEEALKTLGLRVERLLNLGWFPPAPCKAT